MINATLLHTVNSILGNGKPTSNHNYAYKCPFPSCPSHSKQKNKLEINLQPNSKGETPWHCWICNAKGKTLTGLFKKLKVASNIMSELRSILGYTQKTTEIDEQVKFKVELPKEFKPLVNLARTDIVAKHVLMYLKKRGINKSDILKYNIGYCEEGRYSGRIIIPSYDVNGEINYFVPRDINPDSAKKYDAPKCNKNEIIGLEYFINWNVPVILCEGIFDAIAIKRNAIPLLGKTIPRALMMKLVTSNVKTVYVSLDRDALKDALGYAEQLLNLGKDVYLIDLQEKDPSDMGFEKFTKLVHEAEQLTLGELIYKKLELA